MVTSLDELKMVGPVDYVPELDDSDDDDDRDPGIFADPASPRHQFLGAADAAAGERRPPVAEEAPLVLGPRAGVVAARVLLKQKLLVIAGTY